MNPAVACISWSQIAMHWNPWLQASRSSWHSRDFIQSPSRWIRWTHSWIPRYHSEPFEAAVMHVESLKVGHLS